MIATIHPHDVPSRRRAKKKPHFSGRIMNLLLTRSQTLYPLSSVEGMEKCKRIVDVEGGIEFF